MTFQRHPALLGSPHRQLKGTNELFGKAISMWKCGANSKAENKLNKPKRIFL